MPGPVFQFEPEGFSASDYLAKPLEIDELLSVCSVRPRDQARH